MSFQIGDLVYLTKRGAKAHRTFHSNLKLGGAGLAGAAVLPFALPGAFLGAIGIAGGGAAFAVGAIAQAGAGAVGGAGIAAIINQLFDEYPEAEQIGVIKQKHKSLLNGHDYLIHWDNDQCSWHQHQHIKRIDPPSTKERKTMGE